MTGEQWITLAGIVVTGIASSLALIFGYRTLRLTEQERISNNRQVLYEKQLEAFAATLKMLDELRYATNYYITSIFYSSAGDPRERGMNQDTQRIKITQDLIVYVVVLPSSFQDKVSDFLDVVTQESMYRITRENEDQYQQKINNTYQELVKLARLYAGTDPLSLATLALIPTAASKQESKADR